MRFIGLLTALMTSFAFTVPSLPAAVVIRHGEKARGEYIVVAKDRSRQALEHLAGSIAASYRDEILYKFENVLGGFLIRLPEDELDVLSSDPRVDFIEENAITGIPE